MGGIKRRETNIEILRIISILFIICFHYVYECGYEYTKLTTNTLIIKNMWFLGELGVNIFMLITGYYLSKSKASIKKVVLISLQVLFYSLLLYGIENLLVENSKIETIKQGVQLFFPIITGKYWFISAYILIYILSPFYNRLINSFDKRNYQKFLIINSLLWTIIPTIIGMVYNTSENILYYNRFIWLTFVYFIGAYINKFDIRFLKSKKKSLLTFIMTYSIMFYSILVIYMFRENLIQIGLSEVAYFWTPNNILMLILSVSMFKIFTNLEMKSNNVINKIASTTLGIYLLHDSPFSNYIWTEIFHTNINIYKPTFMLHILLAVFTIFIVGVIIDLIRQTIEKNIIRKIVDLKIWSKVYNKIKNKGLILIDKLL